MSNASIFRYFKTSPEIIRLAVMMYVRYPLSLRNVEDLLNDRGIDITYETVRFWWNRFGTIFAAEIRRSRVQAKGFPESALASRRDVREDQRGETQSLARRCPARSERVSSAHSCTAYRVETVVSLYTLPWIRRKPQGFCR
jgi:hypothetical protein